MTNITMSIDGTAEINTEHIKHRITTLDLILDDYRNYITALEVKCRFLEYSLELTEKKLDEMYYRRGVSY